MEFFVQWRRRPAAARLGVHWAVGSASLLITAVIGLGAGSAGAASSPQSISIPITTKTVTVGSMPASIATVNVSVAGGPSVPVRLDTGSSGLVIFSTDVGKKTGGSLGSAYLTYGSGTATGQMVRGAVKVGPVTSPSSTVFLSVPDNASDRQGIASELLGVEGILGIGPSDSQSTFPIYSPLAQLPTPYWQGITVNVAPTGAGTVVAGPVSAPSSATSVPLAPDSPPKFLSGRPAYKITMNMCWKVDASSPQCGPTYADTGSPLPYIDPLTISLPNVGGVIVQPGAQVTLTSPAGAQLWSYSAGATYQSDVTGYFPHQRSGSNTGIQFFFSHTVAFDLAKGQLQVWPQNRY